MRLLKVILLLMVFIFSQHFGQDSNTVNYSIFLEKSVSFGTIDTKVDEGSFKEGQGFTINEADLSGELAIHQNLYNALIGGRFKLDYGSINNDIEMKIFIRNLDPNLGTYLNLGQNQDTLFSYFEIRIVELVDTSSIIYWEDMSFYFNEGYFAHFSLPKSAELFNFLNIVGINNEDSLAFSFLEDNINNATDWNAYGIETINSTDSIKFKAIHLSRIGGGRKRIANTVIKQDSVLGVDINKLKGIPTGLKLNQNYPNPFNPSTKITYSIKESGRVKLDVFNILGKHIFNIIDGNQNPGKYEVEFSTDYFEKELASGIYIYTLRGNNNIISKRMILMK